MIIFNYILISIIFSIRHLKIFLLVFFFFFLSTFHGAIMNSDVGFVVCTMISPNTRY